MLPNGVRIMAEQTNHARVSRVQTGVRLEARILKVLKALAALKGMPLGDLIEGVVLHAFDGKPVFGETTLGQIRDLKKVYGLELTAQDSHRLVESECGEPMARAARTPTLRRKKK